ncbi:MAG: TOBE domain-containing protein, partial [Actinobacteria bacterium]|nr:TOBE domain-containing protein [Actinomycetota bacterium]
RRIQRDSGIATLFVTHDQEEALAISDRVCVMSQGRVEQVGSPQAVYRYPNNPFVARFVGRVNDMAVTVVSTGVAVLQGGAAKFAVPPIGITSGEARLLLRPEDVRLSSPHRGATALGIVDSVHFGGATTSVDVELKEGGQWVRKSVSSSILSEPCSPARLRPRAPPRRFRRPVAVKPRPLRSNVDAGRVQS